jgi:hypothetical protein
LTTLCDQHRIHELLSVYGRWSRVAIKPTLQFDTNRLPNVFQHSKIGESLLTEQIERLASGWTRPARW